VAAPFATKDAAAVGPFGGPRVAGILPGPNCGYSAVSNVHMNVWSGSQHFTSGR